MDALLQGYRKETMKLLCKRSAKADNGRFAWRAVVYHSSVADPKNNDVKTVLEAAVDLCSLQSVCQKRRTCASSSFDRLVPLCKSLEPPGHPFPGMMCPQYTLIARPANVPPLVYKCVLNHKQEIQTARRKESLEACLAKNGLQLRADSSLCSAYIAIGQGEPAHVANVMLEMAWLFKHTNYAEVLQKEKRELHELLSYHNSRVGDCEEFDDSDLDEDWEEISFLEKKLANASEFVKGKAVRTWQCKNSTTSMPQTLMRYPL